jgi:cytochrome c peroxidase
MRSLLFAGLLLGACDDNGGQNGAVAPPSAGAETVFANGQDPDNPFFRALGTNQRTCATCHDPATGWSISPVALQDRFASSNGDDPVFRPVDGANAPGIDVSTLDARQTAYSLLLDRGLIRVERALPDGADFVLDAVSDPFHYANQAEISLYRRPLPATNLKFLSTIMWDSREPTLVQQAVDATLGHAQAMAIASQDDMTSIVAFESSLYTAQRFDDDAGDLSQGARGGATVLAAQPLAVNDPDAASFNRDVFTLFSAWRSTDTSTTQGARRAAIARGEQLFNTKTFRIRGVNGLSDREGTCSTCHNAPNVGDSSVELSLDIRVTDDDDRPGQLPNYTFRRISDGRTIETSDPGLALETGRWSDMRRFKVPSLRALASRPPYFHNGLASDLGDVVRFYRQRFDIRLSDRDESDLAAFLSAL